MICPRSQAVAMAELEQEYKSLIPGPGPFPVIVLLLRHYSLWVVRFKSEPSLGKSYTLRKTEIPVVSIKGHEISLDHRIIV